MGCNASRFEVINGATFLQRLDAIKGRRRPTTLSKKQLLSHRDDMKISVSSRPSDGYNSLQDIITNTPKGAPDPPQEITIETKGSVGIAIIIASNNYGVKVVATEDKPIVSNDDDDDHAKKESPMAKKGVTFVGMEDDDEDDDDDDNERRIGYEDGEAFPGSPSFRVYFEENREHSHNETVKYGDAIPEIVSTGDIVQPKEVRSHVKKKVKREGKKRCFRKVLPKRGSQADVKRLLNMKSCYS